MMRRRILFLTWLAALVVMVAPPSQARGRRPADDDEVDNFPDYNRLEIRPKPKEPPVPPAAVEKSVAPVSRPTLNAPINPPMDDSVPQEPPKAVPLPKDYPEPPMPDDLVVPPGAPTETAK